MRTSPFFYGVESYTNVPHQVVSEIKVKNSKRLYHKHNEYCKKGCQVAWTNGTLLHKPKSKSDSHIGAKKNIGPKKGSKQGELAGTCTCSKCIPKGWFVVSTNTRSDDLVHVL
jgi:hypothetical protein